MRCAGWVLANEYNMITGLRIHCADINRSKLEPIERTKNEQ